MNKLFMVHKLHIWSPAGWLLGCIKLETGRMVLCCTVWFCCNNQIFTWPGSMHIQFCCFHSVSRMTILFQCKSTEPTGHRIGICVVSVVIADGHLTFFRDLCMHVCSHTHFISPKRESQRMQKINVECLISAPKHWQVRDSKPIRTTQPLDNSGWNTCTIYLCFVWQFVIVDMSIIESKMITVQCRGQGLVLTMLCTTAARISMLYSSLNFIPYQSTTEEHVTSVQQCVHSNIRTRSSENM